MAKCHPFNFDGGEELSHMGATWFVSFAYYAYVDSTHRVWENVKTYISRRSIFYRTNPTIISANTFISLMIFVKYV